MSNISALSFVSCFKSILNNFVKPEFHEKVILKQINFVDDKIYLEFDEIYICAKTRLFIDNNSTILTAENIKKIKSNCRKYYIEICEQILTRFNFEDAVLLALQSIDPQNLSQTIVPLIKLFPNLVEDKDIEECDEEWRTLIFQSAVPKTLAF